MDCQKCGVAIGVIDNPIFVTDGPMEVCMTCYYLITGWYPDTNTAQFDTEVVSSEEAAEYFKNHGAKIKINKTYQGINLEPALRTAGENRITVKEGDREYELPLEPSLKLRNHSPTGFSWGYAGSGPAQLALAILLDYSGNPAWALAHYQSFKDRVIAGLSQDAERWGFGSGLIEEVCRD